MKRTKILPAAAILFVLCCLASCSDDEVVPQVVYSFDELELPSMPFNYSNIALPAHLTTNALGPGQGAATDTDNTPANNPTTNAGATLGRVLFYDKKLSANGTVSCASCHKQQEGFSDSQRLSLGFEGGETRRHSMSLVNSRWYDRGRFFWDERAATLEDQVMMPFQDPVEMGMTLDQVVDSVRAQDYYPVLFQEAFGSSDVDADRIAKALAQFVRSMVSVNSKYDTGRQQVGNPNNNFPNFSQSENNGKRIFFQPPNRGGAGCVGCHTTEAFVLDVPQNIGLDATSTDDLGVFESSNNPGQRGAFKVPSLKSIELSAPYMHDGRFATLEEVVEHYNSGIQNHPNLSNRLRDNNGRPIRLNLTEQEKTDLVNFLKTLTDEQMATDEKFSDPFRVN